jgi:hypothetical protein
MRKLIVLSAALGALAVPSVAAAQDPAHEPVVELRRGPDTASPLATYRATAQPSRIVRQHELVAVVSDPPEDL